jgi:hypothetical protein
MEITRSWTEDNKDTNIPRYDFIDPQQNHTRNDRYIEKGDYLAFREVSFSYNIPSQFIQPYVSTAKLYISATNLAYFTGYSGVLPEAKGADYGSYPMPRQVVLGVNVSF